MPKMREGLVGDRDRSTNGGTMFGADERQHRRCSLIGTTLLIVCCVIVIASFLGCIYDQIFWVQNDTGVMFLTPVAKEQKSEQQGSEEPGWMVAIANVATGKVTQISLDDKQFKAGQIAPSADAEIICMTGQDKEGENIQVFRKTEETYARKSVFKNARMNVSSNPWSPRGHLFACWTPESAVSSTGAPQATESSATSEPSVIVIYDADANTSSPLRAPVGFASHAVWSNDGSRIAFYLHQTEGLETFDLCVGDVSTGKIATICSGLQGGSASDKFPFLSCAWSAQDTKIAVAQGNAFVMVDVAEHRPRRLAIEPDDPCADPAPVAVFYPRFSDDGKYLAFCGCQKDEGLYGKRESDIWLVATADQRAKRITRFPGDEYAPAWNARSDRIAFVYGSENCALIAGTVNLDGIIKWLPYDAAQRLALAKDYIVLFDEYFDVMREWKVKADDAFNNAMSFLQKVSINERKTEEMKKLYNEVFQALTERVKQRQ